MNKYSSLKEQCEFEMWIDSDIVLNLIQEKENLERELSRSEKERWKTAANLFKCRKKLKAIKSILS